MEGESQGLVGVTPLGEGLVTLSTLPKSHWSNLQNMDIIKVCVCLPASHQIVMTGPDNKPAVPEKLLFRAYG